MNMASSSTEVKEEITKVKDGGFNCVTCKQNRKVTVEAAVFCQTCGVCFCKKCYKCGHDVLGSSNKQLWGKGTNPRAHDYCVRHPGEVVKLYCKQHDRICCEVCLSSVHHRFCVEMEELNVLKHDDAAEQDVGEIKTDLDHLQTKIEGLQRDRVTRNYNIETTFERCLGKVGQFRRKANTAFDDIETNLSKYRRTYVDRFAGDQTIHTNMLQTLTAYKTQYGYTEKQHTLFDVKSCNEWVVQSTTTLANMNSAVIKDAMLPITNGNVTRVVEDIQMVGKVTLSFAFPSFPIRVDEDTVECVVGGICQMHDGSFILTDTANKKLKKLDCTYKVVDHHQLDAAPRGVCCTSETEVAVAMGNNTVQLIEVGGKFETVKSFGTQDDVWGVAATKTDMYMYWCSNLSQWYNTRDLHISILPRVDNSSWTNHHLDFESSTFTFSFAALADIGLFYIACHDKLVSTNREGKTLASVELKKPSGICVDDLENVYVSVNGTNQILKLDKNCRMINTVVNDTDGFTNPGALCFDRNASRLVVAKKKGDYIYLI